MRFLEKEPDLKMIGFDELCYSIDVLIINICKCVEIYIVALILGTFMNTLVMHISYALLRWSAGGWHARKSLNCSLFGIITFSVFPFITQSLDIHISIFEILLFLTIVFVLIYCYAPSDTEKNPLVDSSERKKAHWKSILTTLLIALSASFFNTTTQFFIVSGILVESVLVTPLFYKLMKVRYNNYEEYAEIKQQK
ncbi:accessory gene regulator ArgB-like protein [Latilactobacillus sakei]|nr:accessory gene regulator B family protein [Latilactobacillus sakei]